jgi:hypothetical protein
MSTELFVLLLIGLVLLVYAGVAGAAWFRMRGTRVVTCPETKQSAAVEVDAAHAAVSAMWEHADVRLKNCSRWPERADCGQPCVGQIVEAPHETLATSILAQYFDQKLCSVCKRPIAPVHASDHQRPGLMEPTTGELMDWNQVKPQDLPEVLSGLQPVCANCLVVETFRRKFPELVTDRHRTTVYH